MSARLLRLVALVAILAMVVAACGDGGSDEDPAEDTEAATEETEAPAEETEAPTEDTEAPAEEEEEPMEEEEEAPEEEESGGALEANILGAGASFPDPVYQTWIGEYTTNVQPGVSIQYESIGSGGGRERFIDQQTIFAGSDAYMDDEEMADAVDARACGEVLHIPMVFGGVVVAYNIEGLDGLVLDSATIADIFSGEITNINDPAIAELNPDVELPDQELTVTVRADGSGTTSIFTTYLEDEDADWAADYGAGDEVDWFGGQVAGEQNDGVASAIAQQPGGIGYVSLEFAVQQGLPTVGVVNGDGNAIVPSTDTVGAAVEGIDLPEDLRFDVLGVGAEGYPIAGATWVLAYTCGYDQGDADALKDYLTWALEEGDSFAADLGYAPLSDATQELSLAKVEQINADG
ncbi:MAG: phosphate ABC transporter substrate-binding protein PstS [Acidimicrobiia bacterium]|nr:phosphate ABC transporter substrate-binding protein PstS [Acidimicrobiia bacterium]